MVNPSIPGARGVPDVPHAAINKSVATKICTEGSGVGASKVPPVFNNNNQQNLANVNNQPSFQPLNTNYKRQSTCNSQQLLLNHHQRFPSIDESDEESEYRVEFADEGLVRLVFTLSDGVTSLWSVKLIDWEGGQAMLIDVDQQMCKLGSKEGFVRLLEAAEDDLRCDRVFVSVRRDHADMKAIMRTFMYLGFALAPPSLAHQFDLNPHQTTLLAYSIN